MVNVKIMSDLDDIFTPTSIWLKNKEKVALATVISTWGSAPRKVGGQMAINNFGEIIGSVSGGCVESSVITEAKAAIEDRKIKSPVSLLLTAHRRRNHFRCSCCLCLSS